MREIPKAFYDFIKENEGRVLRVYDDGRPKKILKKTDKPIGTLTAGYGHTGGDLEIGMDVSQDMADAWLKSDAHAKAQIPVNKALGKSVGELTDNQYAAVLSLAYNTDCDPKWKIWSLIKAKQFDQVPSEFNKFVNARLGPVGPDGKRTKIKVAGLVNRRAKEVVLWSKDEPGSTNEVFPTSVIRAVETPPTPTDPIPPQKSATIITAITAAATGIPVAVGQVTAAVAPYQDKSEIVQKIVAILATLGAIAAVTVLVLTWLTKRQQRR